MSQNTVRAGEYVLGVLSPDERVAVERDAAADPDLAAEIAFWNERFTPLIDNVEAEPPPHVFDRIKAAIRAQESAPVQTGTVPVLAGTVTVRAAETQWEPLVGGVERKILWRGEGRATYLIRGQPGARLPAHDHDDDEETFVLEGDLTIGELTLGPGDFHLARRGYRHPAATTVQGCLLLITERAA
jgi:anti-sigma factor ChrR (cupin superfamily)